MDVSFSPLAGVLAALIGVGGLAGVIVAWRKSKPEAVDIGVGTQERIFGMANEIIDALREELDKRMANLAVLELRIVELKGEVAKLEEQLRTLIAVLVEHGIPYEDIRGRDDES